MHNMLKKMIMLGPILGGKLNLKNHVSGTILEKTMCFTVKCQTFHQENTFLDGKRGLSVVLPFSPLGSGGWALCLSRNALLA